MADCAERGPTGLIGKNKPDAVATVGSMLTDLPTLEGSRDDHRDLSRVEAFLRRNIAERQIRSKFHL
jgi:hypothetical protein